MSKVIRIEEETYRQLAERGKWQDTMDDIILRLLHSSNHSAQEAGR